jgi:D-arabinose 1-dehydrogenase-like Zn-dependent alcohol dehydrogenase
MSLAPSTLKECSYCKMAAGDTTVGSTPTYNGEDKLLGGVTYGGYSESIVVDEGFVLKVSENLNLAPWHRCCAQESRLIRRSVIGR